MPIREITAISEAAVHQIGSQVTIAIIIPSMAERVLRQRDKTYLFVSPRPNLVLAPMACPNKNDTNKPIARIGVISGKLLVGFNCASGVR